LHRADGAKLACCRDGRLERRAFDGGGAIRWALATFGAAVEPRGAAEHRQRNDGGCNFEFVHRFLVE
jgi:hypothetical protein